MSVFVHRAAIGPDCPQVGGKGAASAASAGKVLSVNPKLSVRVASQHGVFSHRDAIECGYTESQIRVRLRRGTWTRLRRGYYAVTPDLGSLPPWESGLALHRLGVLATVRALDASQVAVSHQSAVAMFGLPVWGVDLDTVHVTERRRRTGRLQNKVRHHVGVLDDGAVVTVDGIQLTHPARALCELACTTSYETAVVAMDAALRQQMVTPDALRAAVAAIERWPGSATARAAAAFADGRSESVGESRLRVLMDNAGLPTPSLQSRFLRGDTVVARVDFYFPPQRVVVEFDGMLKYRESAAEVVLAEKAREDALREIGLIVVRVIWDELDTPKLVAHRIRQAFARATPTGGEQSA